MGNHYQERVNRVLDHISTHLDGDLSLAALSAVACFSPFHFHRIFQGVTGETLNAHVRRVRLERAALLMRSSPRRRITDVALATGFAGAAEFSRAFKTHFGFAPSTWDRRSALENSKIGKAPGEMPLHRRAIATFSGRSAGAGPWPAGQEMKSAMPHARPWRRRDACAPSTGAAFRATT